MKFEITKWTVKELLDALMQKRILLNPPYQRNPIWSKKAQQGLIMSLKQGSPIPNIFLRSVEDGKYEMVDGQQRSRALLSYYTTNEIDLTKEDEGFKKGEFLEYIIPVTIITEVSQGEFIEEFYDRVNSSGLRLNRPETLKAKYFAKKFLKVVEEFNESEIFRSLEIIPATSQKRMMDRDLIEELSALTLYGITDKKIQVDKIYDADLSDAEIATLKEKFYLIMDRIKRFDTIKSVKNTRYRQRNDFYTLYQFVKDNLAIEADTLNYFYKILLQFEKGIRPSKSACKPLAEYAFNCVSQSNSAKARQARIDILNDLLLNKDQEPNDSQLEVKEYYDYDSDLIKMDDYFTFEVSKLEMCIDIKNNSEDEE